MLVGARNHFPDLRPVFFQTGLPSPARQAYVDAFLEIADHKGLVSDILFSSLDDLVTRYNLHRVRKVFLLNCDWIKGLQNQAQGRVRRSQQKNETYGYLFWCSDLDLDKKTQILRRNASMNKAGTARGQRVRGMYRKQQQRQQRRWSERDRRRPPGFDVLLWIC